MNMGVSGRIFLSRKRHNLADPRNGKQSSIAGVWSPVAGLRTSGHVEIASR